MANLGEMSLIAVEILFAGVCNQMRTLMLGVFVAATGLVHAAPNPVSLTWENPTLDVAGNWLDTDADGDLSERLTGYRVYRVVSATDDTHVQTVKTIVPWNNLGYSTILSLPRGEHCFVVTAFYCALNASNRCIRSTILESDNSEIVCKRWKRRRPPAQ